MSSAFGRGGDVLVNRIFSDSVRYFAFAGLIAAGAGFWLAGPTVEVLYGPNYLPAVTAFRVMAVVSGLTLAESSFSALLSTTDRQRSRALLVAIQILITVMFAAVLIPPYGFVGALIAHATSRLIGFTLVIGWVSRTYSARLPVRQLLRLMLAAGLAAVPAWGLVEWLHGLVPHALGVAAAVLYVLLLILFSLFAHCWTEVDFALITRLLDQYAPVLTRLRRWTTRLGEHFSA
jgi:O-antigen/teichoic acid export membrane protein